MPESKKSLFENYGFVHLDASDKHFTFLKDLQEVGRLHDSGAIKDKDIIIELTDETVRVAVLKNYIELL